MIGKDIDKAGELLRKGELVAIPTETVYGLAGNGYLPVAVSKIFQVKQRPQFDPLILHTDTLEKAMGLVAEMPQDALKLAEALWPGPLTLVLPRAPQIHDLVTSGLDTVGIRLPRHPLTRELLSHLDFPLAAPSANPFSYISPTTAQHVNAQLGEKIPYILDGGACSVGLESTIVGFPDGEATVLRKGGTSIEALKKILPHIKVQVNSSSRPQAPGMLAKHYSPRTPIVLGNIEELLKQHEGQDVGIISFQELYGLPLGREWVLSPDGDYNVAARRLFEGMRQLDGLGLSVILAELLPEEDLGVAINDRLRRAAALDEEA